MCTYTYIYIYSMYINNINTYYIYIYILYIYIYIYVYSICLEKPSLALKRILLKNKQAFTVFSPSYIIYKEHAVFLGDRNCT